MLVGGGRRSAFGCKTVRFVNYACLDGIVPDGSGSGRQVGIKAVIPLMVILSSGTSPELHSDTRHGL